MLDADTKKLLSFLVAECGGTYKIFDESELCGALPEGTGGTAVSDMLTRLEAQRYLDIRYAEGGEFCLCPLPSGVRFLEELDGERTEKKRRRREEGLLVFLASLAGGFLGGVLAAVIVWAVL